ncbi:VWA domain-containing protein [Gemmatirosa kalamazoonensis]|uniref:VWA domain-containing protein n=1 Tax=Gemmatirosa kalamazoonensis TaxID=861299 RepID=UPI00130D4C0B|nr:VWA domain-containing protein [Gemmatirosa kalamazoonensis]
MSLDRALELLLKYRPALYAQGRLAFDAPRPAAWALALVGTVLVAVAVTAYRGGALRVGSTVGSPVRRRAHPLLAALRAAAIVLLVVCLLRPVLVLDAAVPRRNTVAVLVDDSRSMRVRDFDGRPRADFARAMLGSASPLRRALGEQFAVRVYRFSDVAAPVDSVGALAFAGDRTRLGAALDRVREELDGVPLAGVVVVSDGADGAPSALADATTALRARGTPVFAVGVGAEATGKDVEVRRVEAPRRALKGSTVAVDVVLAHRGLAGDSAAVLVEEDGRILARRAVVLPNAGDAVSVRVPLPLPDAGLHRLTVRVPPVGGEPVAENNARDLLLDVRDEREQVLYFEGEPRFEAKFLRRAVADDQGLRVVLLQRTAEGKYLRLGVEDSLDLVGGFPTSRDVLFKYKAVILGSVEASAFTVEQLRMLADFVSVRGGSLVLLGGRRAFAEGGFAGTPLEEAMPVVLERPLGSAGSDRIPATEVAVRLTAAGAAHVPLQVAPDERASLERWRTLPPLTTVNLVKRVRPGATVLLTGQTRDSTRGGDDRVVLAYQRYGRGKVVAFPVQDTWLWQMHASIPVEDMTHELLWRQLLRWLTADVPRPVEVVASDDHPAPGETVELRASVRDSLYVPVNGASVVARVQGPTGAAKDVPLTWSVARDGEYRGSFVAAEAGPYTVTATRGGPDSAAIDLDAMPSREEYFESALRAPLLRQLATQTGGRYYTPATVGSLPEDLRYAKGGVTVTERKDLWDLPATFLLLGGLLAGEWALRRREGLA